MSKIVGDSACPNCRASGNDRTGNHLIMFEDGGAFCNRCGYKTNWKDSDIKPQERKEISDEELAEALEEFKSCATKAYDLRGLTKATVEYYGCKVGAHQSDKDKIGSYLMPYHEVTESNLVGYKVRLVEHKKFWNVGRPKQAGFFGRQTLPKTGDIRRLIIAESAMDAMSVHQAVDEVWKSKKFSATPTVVGLPHGTGSIIATFEAEKKLLSRCKEIVLVLDNDAAGKEAVEKAIKYNPEIKVVYLEEGKDPNDYLMEGKGNELANLVQFSSATVKLDGMVDISELTDAIITPPTMGKEWPWKTMTNLTYGRSTPQIIGIAGGVGMGKSDLKNTIISHSVEQYKDHNTVFDLEYGAAKSGRLLASKIARKPLHKPDSGVTSEDIAKALEPLAGHVSLYKHDGSRDWKDIKEYIRHSVIVNNSKIVHLDPITALVAHLNASEANDALNTIFSDVSSLAQELDFTFVYYAHLNPPKTGPSHERGGKVNEAQMTGSRAMMKWSTHIWGLEGTKDPDLPEHERNVRKMVLLKDRDYGNVGSFYLYYNPETTELLERF